jgi:acetyl-CoA/propionyl-CoA carboxylase biotin carboxyl carrier protein
MFQKVLVANRGEIAVRVMRTLKEMRIGAVGVYSEIDRDTPHVRESDEAFLLGPAIPAESYLSIPKILETAQKAGAEAIHPGYGFLAENAEFARACAEAGIVFIGPPPEAIDAMGSKTRAREIMAEAGVPIVPGATKAAEDLDEARAQAEEAGYPVAAKAAGGGGGKGFRVAMSADELEEAFDGAAREGEKFFSDPRVYIERYLEDPRHVEVQVLADSHGTVIHLGERDCSIQRRHQKLIEEAPAPHVDDEMRARIGKIATDAAEAVGYRSAGTVEGLQVGEDYFFLEMNTRIQVEHCVTELVTGLDIVREQVRIAAGEELSISQQELEMRGHSIECRINAEDPAKKFLPSPGTITRLRVPSGPGVRWDGGYAEGDTISQYYDNLIGKLVVWAPDRDQAIARMLRALSEFEIGGVKTTIPAHVVLLQTAEFREARHSTKWVEDEVDAASFTTAAPAALEVAPPAADDPALVERTVPVEVDGRRYSVKVWLPDAPVASRATTRTPQRRPKPGAGSGGSGAVGSGTLTAPMQGTIVKVLVEVGASVETGQAVLVLEAMKMENQINAETSGTVKELRVKPGDGVGTGDVLAIIE